MEDTLLKYYNEMNKKYDRYKPHLSKTLEMLNNINEVEEKVKIIKDLYAFVKGISKEFYSEERNEFIWLENIVTLLSYCENTLNNEYLIDVTTNFNENYFNQKEEAKVNEIIKLTRESLLEEMTMHGRYSHPFDFYNLENYCETACDNTSSICDKMSIKHKKIIMRYGFNKNLVLFNGRGYHCFIILEINGIWYLVDCTYKQFFLLKKCLLERIGIPYLGGCYPGVFMMMDENRRKVAEKLLRDGWIYLTPNNFKDYMESFLLSWRNGTFYEETNDFSYTTPYTAEDYWNFLNEKDDLLNYERKRTLGFQDRPLKNPKMTFDRC